MTLAVGYAMALAVATSFRIDVWRDSLSLFRDATAANPDDWRPGSNLMNTYIAYDKPEEAISIALEYLPRYPDYSAFHYGLGHSLLKLGHEREGISELEVAAGLDPREPRSWTALAGHAAAKGDMAEARDLFLRAAEARPADVTAWYNVALANLKLGLLDEAASATERIRRIDPDAREIVRLEKGIGDHKFNVQR
jgi:tetratricopeptide (TPR) repeat protein